MGVVRRSFKCLDEETFKKLYKGVVRPHLEYGVQIWNPNLKKDIVKLEGVQRRATKQVNKFKDMDYKERLEKLQLPTLIYRRLRGDMIEVYKNVNGKYDQDIPTWLPLKTTKGDQAVTRGHSKKLHKKKATRDTSKFAFTRRVVNIWNSLPESVVTAPTLYSFENRLDRHWQKQRMVYDFEAALALSSPLSDKTVHAGNDQGHDPVYHDDQDLGERLGRTDLP